MPEQYWLSIRIGKTDNKHRITHDRLLTLKAYFDENPSHENVSNSYITYMAEYSSVNILNPQGGQQFDFQLTEAEFNADNFLLHIWGEPYGYVTVQKEGTSDNLYVGRLKLEPQHCYKGTLIYQPNDRCIFGKQIFCEINIGQSIVNYAADEINYPAASSGVLEQC